LRERLGVRAAVTHRWAALVSFHRGRLLPLVEQVRPGVWAAGAYNGTGNVLGALCGRGLAQLAARGRSELLAGLID
jgi:glycine/D-amino acid oxidase-like deaminating enzyme